MPQTPYPSSRSMEETLLMLDHLLGKMARAADEQNEIMRVQLSRLQAAASKGVPPPRADDAMADDAERLSFCIQECSEWLRNHQHAAEQHIRAIQELTELVLRLNAAPIASDGAALQQVASHLPAAQAD